MSSWSTFLGLFQGMSPLGKELSLRVRTGGCWGLSEPSPSSFLSLQTSGSPLVTEVYGYLQAFHPQTDPTLS